MKTIVLVTNRIFHYRIPVYNYIKSMFAKYNINFIVIGNEQPNTYDSQLLYEQRIIKPNINKLFNILAEIKPDVIISFLIFRNKLLIPTILWAKYNKIPFIYWAHGINIKDPNNILKRLCFGFIHAMANAIILYSPNEKKYISSSMLSKTFVAYNTLYISPQADQLSKDEIKNKYEIPFKKIVLFVGRIQKRKRLDILIDIFKDKCSTEIGLVIVGPNISDELSEKIKDAHMIKYLGPIFNEDDVNNIFKMSDVFSIPGQNGLGINQAMYWGLPCVTIDGLHGPEIFYLRNGYNGFIAKNAAEYSEKIQLLCTNDTLYKKMSHNAYNTMRTVGNIENMFKGFYDAVTYVENIK